MIQRLLEGAENVIAHAPHCWLMTLSQSGGVDARPMGGIIPAMSQNDWCLYFLADSRSKKVRDIHSARQVRLIFEQGVDAFVSLAGVAKVISDTAIIVRRWIPTYDRIFPSAADKANAVFIDIRAEELRLWIRGLTPEPFGVRSLTLRRPLDGDWHLDSECP
jgi:general stress protein 26